MRRHGAFYKTAVWFSGTGRCRQKSRWTRGGDPCLKLRGYGMDTTLSFGQRNFGTVQLGHKRRTERLVEAVDCMCRHPGGTLPDKLHQPADLRAFYRLMNRPEVTHDVLIRSHAEYTGTRIATSNADVVLILHDATELDYTTKLTLRDHLGQIGEGTHRGYI